MKVTAFSGSPRKNGNSEILIHETLTTLKEQGHETNFFRLNSLNIKPCQADNACKKNDECVMKKDDMEQLYKEIDRSDALILGSPVYMWQMSAQAKIFVDRLYAYYNPGKPSRLKGKSLVLIFTQGHPDAELFKNYFDHTRTMFEFLGFTVKDVIVGANAQSKGEIKENKKAMEQAKNVFKD